MKENEVLISVIIPIYNVAPYLEKCVHSVLNQSYKNLEIILVDDGSTDGCSQLCDKLGVSDHRVKVLHQENKGLVCARKAGVEAAKGNYVAFVDGDDWIESGMYEDLLENIVVTNADFVHSEWYSERDGVISNRHYYLGNIVFDETYDKQKLLKNCLTNSNLLDNTIVSKLYKKDFFRSCYANVPDDQSQGEDLLCFCESILRSKIVAVSKNAYYHYVYRNDSLSHKEDILLLSERCRCYYHLERILFRFNCNEDLLEINRLLMEKDILKRLHIYKKLDIPHLYFHPIEMLRNKRVVLAGAGKVGRDYYTQISKYNWCKIVAWTDTHYDKYSYDYAEVVGLNEIKNREFDLIIIAIKSEYGAQEMKNSLVERGIPEEKILWRMPKSQWDFEE